MTTKVIRVYVEDSGTDFPEDFIFSIVADDTTARYVFPDDGEVSGLDDGRILEIKNLLAKDEEISSALDWLDIAAYRTTGTFVDGPEYKNLEEAVSLEKEELNKSKELRDDLSNLDDEDQEEDLIFFDEDDEDEAEAVTAAVSCPPATQDIALNLKNRKNAIDTAMYGPLNPDEPNDEYWQALGSEWGVDVQTAKQQRCGNCAVFVVTSSMKDCISQGLTGETQSDEFDAIDEAGELGYCEAFDFKCASARTCRAWVAGGPIDDSKAKEQ